MASELRGRSGEREALDDLLAEVRAGRSRVLVVRGEPGIGKTALLDYLAERAPDGRIVRAAGVESEMELAFAGLHQLCAPMLDRLDALPAPQRQALATAFGLSSGGAPDRFLVGLAVLGLLAELSEAQPLVCLVDDAQWFDQASAQTLAFVARRLMAEPVALVFATRRAAAAQGLRGLPELVLEGLNGADARALLDAAIRGPLDPAVRDAIVAETRGNPLALLEIPRGLTPAELAGGFALPDALPGRIEESFRRRLAALPRDTQRLVLVAAAEPIGEPMLLWRAAQELGLGYDAADPATANGLIEIGARVRFRHPLVRSAIYRAAPSDERRAAHRALAAATDPDIDPDRRAWHRAHATATPDEDVAAELERSAVRARARGGLAAEAAFLARAAELTVDGERRTERLMAAARAKYQAGAPEEALSLLAAIEAAPLSELQSARVALLRGQLAFGTHRGREAPGLLLAAAKRLEPLDPQLARETYLDALSAAFLAGRLARDAGLAEVAAAARTAPGSTGRAPDLLLDAIALAVTEGLPAGAPLMKQALRAFRDEDLAETDAIRWLWLATHAAHDIWDDESWEELCSRHLRLARRAGALNVLPIVLSTRRALHVIAGELSAAEVLTEEGTAVAEATGNQLPPYGAAALAARRGREAEATALFAAAHVQIQARGEGMGLSLIQHSTALLYNGLGRYEEALAAAELGAELAREMSFFGWALAELVEAAVRAGRPERAAEALARLSVGTQASGSEWALGTEARARGLVTGDEDAYREAIDRLSRTRVRYELARAQLVYGEWLRREGRRRDAREQLRTAHDAFVAMGAEAFAERARRELVATGEKVRKRSGELRDELTAQETQIARLAAEGRTNPEIGAELFISPRTVEWHLRKVYAKLGVSSRKQLRG